MPMNPRYYNQYDMDLLRAGWAVPRKEFETRTRSQMMAKLTCSICCKVARLLQSAADWFGACATRLYAKPI